MQSLSMAEQVSRCIPLAIGYAVIVGLFLKCQLDLKRYRSRAERPCGVSNPAPKGQGTGASVNRVEARPRYQSPMERAELLRTFRRGETVARTAAGPGKRAAPVRRVTPRHSGIRGCSR